MKLSVSLAVVACAVVVYGLSLWRLPVAVVTGGVFLLCAAVLAYPVDD